MKTLIYHIGRYIMLMGRVFAPPEKKRMYYKQTLREIEYLGINSIGIVAIISVFIGAVITIQTAYNTESPLYPRYLIGLAARDVLLLEFSSTIVALILAGKIGSNIASEIGTMRITEQIDALEIMGVNSVSYLILPKLFGAIVFFPLLTLVSIILGIAGGLAVSLLTQVVTVHDYLDGLHMFFNSFYILYTLVKMLVYAFLIVSVSAYQGYYTNGGALEV